VGEDNKEGVSIEGARGVISVQDPGSSEQTTIRHDSIYSDNVSATEVRGEKLEYKQGLMESLTLGGRAIDYEDPVSGKLEIRDDGDSTSIRVDGNDARIELGKQGGNDGDVVVHNKDRKETIHLGGNDARLELGHEGGGNDGDVFVHDKERCASLH